MALGQVPGALPLDRTSWNRLHSLAYALWFIMLLMARLHPCRKVCIAPVALALQMLLIANDGTEDLHRVSAPS